MSDTQKDAVYAAIVKSFEVSGADITASCMYENQIIPDGRDSTPYDSNVTYPLITLKYRDSEVLVNDINGDTIVKNVRLDVNVFATPIDNRAAVDGVYINGKVIVDAMAHDILKSFNENNSDLFVYGVMILDRIKGVRIRDLSTISTRKHVYRNKFTLNIGYEV